jgi:tRNA nucleotidyltransferase (CCA-adding enzyme)
LDGVRLDALGIPEGAARLPESLDLVSARTEFYAHPSALPEVENGNLKLDLHRRDFTINTLALSLNQARFGEVHDYWGGMRDLEEKRIRVLHSLSFIDDPTRILRAARLEQRLGFQLEPRTSDLIRQALPLLHRVSGDRVRHELEAVFEEPDPSSILARLQELGVLQQIHPALHWDSERRERMDSSRTFVPDPRWGLSCHGPDCFLPISVWLLGHPEPVLASVLTRLNFPRREADKLLAARHVLVLLATLDRHSPPSRIAELLDPIPLDSLSAAWLESAEPARTQLARYMAEWRKQAPVTDGTALQASGLQPGPRYREILRTLRNAWLDQRITTAEEETHLLNQLLRESEG